MAINSAYKHNFDSLLRAAKNQDLAVLECTEKATGKVVMTVCAVVTDKQGRQFYPLAQLFDGNPYEELIPPRS